MLKASKQHLNEAHKTYWEHGHFAISAGFLLILAGLASLLHAVIPALFPFWSRDIVHELAQKSQKHTVSRQTDF